METAHPVVLDGLAAFFGVSSLYFQSVDVVARQVYEGLRLLSAARKGAVGEGQNPGRYARAVGECHVAHQ